jgi:type II secretory pathway component GspD/PulD (secretin)
VDSLAQKRAVPTGKLRGPKRADISKLTASSSLKGEEALTVGELTGISTNPQFPVAAHLTEQRGGVDLLSAPKVKTLGGKQANIDAGGAVLNSISQP